MIAAIGSLQSSPGDIKMTATYFLTRLILIGLGAIMIWLGPSLSGFATLHGAWCTSSDPGALTQLGSLAWQATQHCPYCFIGMAFIALGIFGANLGRVKPL